jgi:hypothetical protein
MWDADFHIRFPIFFLYGVSFDAIVSNKRKEKRMLDKQSLLEVILCFPILVSNLLK